MPCTSISLVLHPILSPARNPLKAGLLNSTLLPPATTSTPHVTPHQRPSCSSAIIIIIAAAAATAATSTVTLTHDVLQDGVIPMATQHLEHYCLDVHRHDYRHLLLLPSAFCLLPLTDSSSAVAAAAAATVVPVRRSAAAAAAGISHSTLGCAAAVLMN